MRVIFQPFHNEVKSVLDIKESHSMKKSPNFFLQKIHIEFYKRRGGGSKAVYKLYKKTGNLVSDGLPK